MSPVEISLILALDYASVVIFALSGALVASRAQLDVVGFIFFAALTAVGGGTIRDLLLGREVFWMARPELILIASVAALVVFLGAHLLESRYRALVWLDAGALAVAVPAGVGAALSEGRGAIVVLIMGVITGTFGGIARDVVSNEVPLVLKQGELYLSAAFGGALAALMAPFVWVPPDLTLIVCGAVTFLLRAGSMAFSWSLPAYKSRPPKV